ncbi:dipeptidyl aminopeptidase B [Pseudozyma hubeiensis SY62]|uniref:Dipeptidyl aminopeptidase B n=1 Tax=Pseudozyma hubeiensis (strain SY62) TaxID=1305764 RepID=R9PBM0_PSEHS|nr:dipeptidyl aminopeptidase B [Pseudozyma hubeiensis SY62]GAC98766.1 dipeptidyl aminopeptidase B [Pseudozyma hubeiensis SY62]
MRYDFKTIFVHSLVLIQLGVCHAGDYWKAVEALVNKDESSAIAHFLQTGDLGSSSASPSSHQPEALQGSSSQHIIEDPWFGPRLGTFLQDTPSSGETRVASGSASSEYVSPHIDEPPTKIDHIGSVLAPQPLTVDERMTILKPIGDEFASRSSHSAASNLLPYTGQSLTAKLLDEAFGFPKTSMRLFTNDIFVMPSTRSQKPPLASIQDGGMAFTMPRTHHLYIWKMIKSRNSPGCIYQLVGAVESGISTHRIALLLKGFQPARKINVLSRDSIYDESLPSVITAKSQERRLRSQ